VPENSELIDLFKKELDILEYWKYN
jgi:hypothetical protein